MKPLSRLGRLAAFALALAGPIEAGTVTGHVSNSATGNLLEGAKIEVPALGLSTLTDPTGRYILGGLPAGTHTLVVSYLGLDTMRADVTVAADGGPVRNFDLTAAIYQMSEYRVTGEREGAAAAITAQRNAGNIANIVAVDSFGNLPNMSVGEVAARLPGVASELDSEGNVTSISIRGMPSSLNSVTIDSALIASEGGMSRSFPMSIMTGALFEQVELTKGQTPDKGVSSMGGTLDLKTRSPLGMREKRRVTYNLGARWAPPFVGSLPLRAGHRLHPLLNAGYQEVFDVFGGERNLGVAVNAFYSENVNTPLTATRDFQNTTATPAYLWDFRTEDRFNNRRQASLNVKADYRLSAATKLSFNAVLADNNEPFQRRYSIRMFTTQSVGTTGTAGILPGYTSRITQVRPVAGSTIDITDAVYGFFQRLRNVSAGAEHAWGPLQVDYHGAYSSSHGNQTNAGGGVITHRLANVGWIIDRTPSDLHPRVTQAGGADFTNPANYRPTANGLTTRNNDRDHEIREARGNVRYTLPLPFPVAVKSGAQWREQTAANFSRDRQWSYVGPAPLPADPSLVMQHAVQSGLLLPHWEPAALFRDQEPVNPAWWNENLYFRETRPYVGNTSVTETVSAGYAMLQGRLGATRFLGGVRTERTETGSAGWVRARRGTTAAEQLADPAGAARRDYANTRRELRGRYTHSFPSVHLAHDVTRDLKARLSWSTGMGRPPMSNLLPNETVNETTQTLTINNPSLLPQRATNWDATLDYYFEPVGNLSVGWFHKDIRDYILSGINVGTVATGPDNGYDGEYGGFTLLSRANGGTAVVQGWEFSYQQQLTFLPGWLRGLGVSANYTVLRTHGDFGGTDVRSTREVAGFVPRTANVSLSWRQRAFSTRVLVNYTGPYITSYTAASLGRNQYLYARTSVNVGCTWQVRPSLNLTLDVSNPFNEPQAYYRGNPDQMSTTIITGTTLTVGVNGRF